MWLKKAEGGVLDGFIGSGEERTRGGGPGLVLHAEGKGEEGEGGLVAWHALEREGGSVSGKARGGQRRVVSGRRRQGIEQSG
jgi:hypothetical protein